MLTCMYAYIIGMYILCMNTYVTIYRGFFLKNPFLSTLPSSPTTRCGTYPVIVIDKSLVASLFFISDLQHDLCIHSCIPYVFTLNM